MTSTDKVVRVGGAWFATASFLMIIALGFHGRIDPDLNVQMARIADAAIRWALVHWIAAAALSLYAVSGLIILTSRSRLTDGWWTMTAWAVIPVGALWTMTTAVAETTVVVEAAVSGSSEIYEAWWAFAEGKANGFTFLALAVAVIAANEARASAGVTPAWSAWVAMVAGVASFAGWVLRMWFGVSLGNLLWLVASIAMSVWTFWFGVMLMRFQVNGKLQSH
jgi:hypothetical protein